MGMVVRGWVSVAILAGLSSGLAMGGEVPWRSQYAMAKKEAKARNLPMLLVISCPGCGWCEKLHSTTLHDPQIAQTLKTRYVPVAVVSRNDPWLMQALSIQAYPTVIVASADSDIMFRHEGFLDAAQLQMKLEQVAVISQVQQPVVLQQPALMAAPMKPQRHVTTLAAPVRPQRQVVPIVAPVQPVAYQQVEPARSSYHVSAPSVSTAPYEVAMPISQKIEQARYEMIKSSVPAAEVIPVQHQQPMGSMQPYGITTSPVSTTVLRETPVNMSTTTTMREVNPIGPRYYGYPPPMRSPYAK